MALPALSPRAAVQTGWGAAAAEAEAVSGAMARVARLFAAAEVEAAVAAATAALEVETGAAFGETAETVEVSAALAGRARIAAPFVAAETAAAEEEKRPRRPEARLVAPGLGIRALRFPAAP